MQPIILSDGTELEPLEAKEKEALEAEIKVILDKYNASYLPVIKEERTITHISQKAGLLLLKKKEKGVPSTSPEINPLLNNGESNDTNEDSKAD